MIDLTPMGGCGSTRTGGGLGAGRRPAGSTGRATQHCGLATTAGNLWHTAASGLTLGGGMGWLAREYGLACWSPLPGEVVRASAARKPGLFWGLRGGGGNLGVVTEFEFQLHATGTQTLIVELDSPTVEAAPALACWRDRALAGPRRATHTALISGRVVALGFVWVGDPGAGRELARSLEVLTAPVAQLTIELTCVDLQRCGDTPQGHALRRYLEWPLPPRAARPRDRGAAGPRTADGGEPADVR